MTNELPRIGLGIDVHRLEPGRPFILGGVRFDCEVGPVGVVMLEHWEAELGRCVVEKYTLKQVHHILEVVR